MAGDEKLRELEERYEGYTVYDQDGDKIGKVDDIFLDETDREEYVGVKMGLFGLSGTTLIPMELASVDEQEKSIRVSEDKSRVTDAPSYKDDDEVTLEYEARIREHYRLEGPGGSQQRGSYGPAEGVASAGGGMDRDREERGMEREGGMDREEPGMDREERSMSREERGMGGEERDMEREGGMEREGDPGREDGMEREGIMGREREERGMDREGGMGREERSVGSERDIDVDRDRELSGERGMGSEERGMDREERGMSGEERDLGGEERGMDREGGLGGERGMDREGGMDGERGMDMERSGSTGLSRGEGDEPGGETAEEEAGRVRVRRRRSQEQNRLDEEETEYR